jgi:hypothetical protein
VIPRRILFAHGGTRRGMLIVQGGRPRSAWRELLEAEHRQQLPQHFADMYQPGRPAGVVGHEASLLRKAV